MQRVLDEPGTADFCTIEPVTAAEAREYTGTEQVTREHVEAIHGLASQRWFGRCVILHTADGEPQEIYFWGFSGD